MNDLLSRFLPLIGVGLIAAFLSFLLSEFRSGIGIPVRMAGLLSVYGTAALLLVLFYREIGGLLPGEKESVAILSRALGIALLTGLTAELSRGFGEGGIAGGIEMIGKAAILLVSLPLVKEVFSCVDGLL